jgi:hypothetical protein
MFPALPQGSKISIVTTGSNCQIIIAQSLVGIISRWLVIIFAGWLLLGVGEAWLSTLSNILDRDTSAEARWFLIVWEVGWSMGGLIFGTLWIGLVFRPAKEKILLETNKLVWTPAYPLMTLLRFRGLKSIKFLFSVCARQTKVFLRSEIDGILIWEQRDSDTGTVHELVILKYEGQEFTLARDSQSKDSRWLNQALNVWIENSPRL